jgi:hypothetical protein
MIPKADGSLRPLGIPTLRDRVAQMAVKLVIEPIFEADFCAHSYGFRPRKSAHDAVDDIAQALWAAYTHLIDAPDRWLAAGQAKHLAMQHALDFARHPVGDRRVAFEPDYSLVAPWALFDSWHEAVGILLLHWSVQGIAVFGSLYFRTVPFIKTVLSCLLLLLASVMLSTAFHSQPILVLGYWDFQRLLSSLQEIFYPALWLGFPGLFWLASFMALKEREIAA